MGHGREGRRGNVGAGRWMEKGVEMRVGGRNGAGGGMMGGRQQVNLCDGVICLPHLAAICLRVGSVVWGGWWVIEQTGDRANDRRAGRLEYE